MDLGARCSGIVVVLCFRPLEGKVKVRQTAADAGVLKGKQYIDTIADLFVENVHG